MATPEKKVKETVKAILKEYGAYFFMPPANGYGTSGVFDICCAYKGHFIGIECKSDDKKCPTGLQSSNAAKAFAAGASVMLIHVGNVDEVSRLLERINHGGEVRFSGESFWPSDSAIRDPK